MKCSVCFRRSPVFPSLLSVYTRCFVDFRDNHLSTKSEQFSWRDYWMIKLKGVTGVGIRTEVSITTMFHSNRLPTTTTNIIILIKRISKLFFLLYDNDIENKSPYLKNKMPCLHVCQTTYINIWYLSRKLKATFEPNFAIARSYVVKFLIKSVFTNLMVIFSIHAIICTCDTDSENRTFISFR